MGQIELTRSSWILLSKIGIFSRNNLAKAKTLREIDLNFYINSTFDHLVMLHLILLELKRMLCQSHTQKENFQIDQPFRISTKKFLVQLIAGLHHIIDFKKLSNLKKSKLDIL